jgi:hypothetical protein
MTPDERRYTLDAFEHWARSGYEPDVLDELDERLADLLPEEPPPAFVAEVKAHTQRVLDEQRAAEATWTMATANDHLTEAFAELEDRGIVALENAGYTTSDGWSDCNELAADFPDVRGACFFHGQDVERGVRGEGLLLVFGSYVEGAGHDAASIELGREICAVLASHGLPTEWNGSVKARIQILPFPWRKRQYTESPL